MHQLAELAPLLIGDRGVQVLNFDQPFADEYDLSHFGNSGDPGIAKQLRIEG